MSIWKRARRFWQAEEGLALVEFAGSLPVLLGFLLFGLEVANFAMANLRVSQAAMLVADYAARERDTIDEAKVNELLLGARLSGDKIRLTEHGRIILSSLERNTAGTGQWIRWQRCLGAKVVNSTYGAENAGQNNNSLQGMGEPGNQIAAAPGQAVMVAEIIYDYQPLIAGNGLIGARRIQYTGAFTVRKRTDQVLKNASNMPNSKKSLCSRYTAA